MSGFIEEREESFSGNEWADLIIRPTAEKREELNSLTEQFLANGGKIVEVETVSRNEPTMFNNRSVAFYYDQHSIFSRNEHDGRFKNRVYGTDKALVERIRDYIKEGESPEKICDLMGTAGKQMSLSRFKRLVINYMQDEKPAYRILASFNDLSISKRRELDQIAIDALFEAYGAGLLKREAWDSAAEKTGFTVRTIIAIAYRRDTERLWKKNKK